MSNKSDFWEAYRKARAEFFSSWVNLDDTALYGAYQEEISVFLDKQTYLKRPPKLRDVASFYGFCVGWFMEYSGRYDCWHKTIAEAESWFSQRMTSLVIGYGVVAPDVDLGNFFGKRYIKAWWVKANKKGYIIGMLLLCEHELDVVRKKYEKEIEWAKQL